MIKKSENRNKSSIGFKIGILIISGALFFFGNFNCKDNGFFAEKQKYLLLLCLSAYFP